VIATVAVGAMIAITIGSSMSMIGAMIRRVIPRDRRTARSPSRRC
jgi:hypothetical protein